jgi:hypothetical protein
MTLLCTRTLPSGFLALLVMLVMLHTEESCSMELQCYVTTIGDQIMHNVPAYCSYSGLLTLIHPWKQRDLPACPAVAALYSTYLRNPTQHNL